MGKMKTYTVYDPNGDPHHYKAKSKADALNKFVKEVGYGKKEIARKESYVEEGWND